jgi:MarR family transcriptional regulator, 2-MHQ and catechol-resistance regulon repressor
MPTHYRGHERTVRALNAYINLARASDSVFGRMAAQLESQGLTLGQFGVLEALLHLGPMCQHTLAEKLLRSGGNVTLVVDNLEKRGWAQRERQKADRRQILIRLTAGGRRLISRVFPSHAKAIEREMSFLDAGEQMALRRICRKLGRGERKLCAEPQKREKNHGRNST